MRVGGHDLRTLHPEDLHRQIAVVNQDTYLFHGTVEDNLRLGKPDASPAELEEAARAANAHEFIVRLPQGYDTVVGERGIRLSGGQRQRVAIARALLRDAPILVLDEALSAVDAQNEAVIQEALDRLMQGRTSLIFAHRLSSVIGADRILVLDEGGIVESGTHLELMERRGHYHALMSAQAQEGASVDEAMRSLGDGPEPESTGAPPAYEASLEPTDAIVEAQGMGWLAAFRELFAYIVPWRAKLAATFSFGILRVACLIGVGVFSALTVAAVKTGEPYGGYLVALGLVAPFAGLLHWLESWFAHDMAFRLLAEMRIALFRKLDRLAPAYLVRRRTGDLVAMATHDVELVEYFFAHTVTPAFVAVLVPMAVIGVLMHHGWLLAIALVPFLVVVGLSPVLSRRRLDDLGSRAREALGNLNAHTVDTIQGLGEIAAFEHAPIRRAQFVDRATRHLEIRLPFFRDLTFQKALLETATGLGGLVVVAAAVHLTHRDGLASELVPLLTLLAMSAFLPVSEIAQIGRQLADTLGSTRRLYAVRTEKVLVDDGPGAEPVPGAPALEFEHVGIRVPARAAGASRPELPRSDGAHRRPRGTLRRRQDHRRAPAAALLGSAGRHGADVRGIPAELPPRRPARSDRAGESGYLPVQRDPARQHPHGPAGRERRGAHGRGAPRLPRRFHQLSCPTASIPGWASAACDSPAGSASGSQSPAPFSRTRRY